LFFRTVLPANTLVRWVNENAFVRAKLWIVPTYAAHAFLKKIVVGEEASVIVSFKPIARMDLIEVGSNKFLSQFLVLVAQERNLWPGELREPDRRVWHRHC
jgi:hypothetical protein